MLTFWIRKQDSNVADLPEDLVRKHILSRLPAKSLFIFKSVCKKWHNWISTDRLFAALLYSNSNKGFLLQDGGEMSTTENPDHCFKLEEDLLVGGSTHGLLYGRCRDSNKDEILICNPITKHKAFVPNPNRRCNIALAVDAPYYPNNGFVVIAALDSTLNGLDPNCFKFEVYSSKENQWRAANAEVQIPSPDDPDSDEDLDEDEDSDEESEGPSPDVILSDCLTCGTIFVGGNVYWFLRSDPPHTTDYIMWFDHKKDVAGFIQCPRPRPRQSEIGASNGELSYSMITKKGDIEIWLLRHNKENCEEFQWVKKHTVSLQEVFDQNWKILSKFCRVMKLRTRKKAAVVMASKRLVFPMPYLDGEEVWFWMGNLTKSKHGKLLSINLGNQELMVYDKRTLPLCAFSATFLPCSN